MSVIILCLVALIALCVLYLAVKTLVEAITKVNEVVIESVDFDSPEEIAKAAKTLVDYELPPGYSGQYGASLPLLNWIYLAFGSKEKKKPAIVLIRFPGRFIDTPEEVQEIHRQMRQRLQKETRSENPPFELELMEKRVVTIRGEKVTLTTSEGMNEDETRMRQLFAAFCAKNKRAVGLMILGPTEGWDQTAVDSFIASLR